MVASKKPTQIFPLKIHSFTFINAEPIKQLTLEASKGTKMPLIIKGCRQCGKTFSVLNFAKKHYGNVHTSPLYGFPPHRLLTVTKTMPCTPAAGLSPHLGDNPWYITDTCEQSVLKTLRKTRQVICGCCSPTTSLLSDISSYPSR